MSNNLNNRIIGTSNKWKDRARVDRKNRKKISRAQKFALELLDYMEDHGLKQKDLAVLMKVSPQQVNKILRAKANLTFETIDKIADALDVTISDPRIKSKRTMQTEAIYSMQIVHKSSSKVIEENLSTSTVVAKNPFLETSLESVQEYEYTADQI